MWWRGQGLMGGMEPTGSDICCLMSDKDGLHDWWVLRSNVLAWRSVLAGAFSELSTPGGQSTSNTGWKWVVGGVIANQIDKSLCRECPSCFLCKITLFLLFFFFSIRIYLFYSFFSGSLQTMFVMENISFKENRAVWQQKSKLVNKMKCISWVILLSVYLSASWQSNRPKQSQLPQEYSGLFYSQFITLKLPT